MTEKMIHLIKKIPKVIKAIFSLNGNVEDSFPVEIQKQTFSGWIVKTPGGKNGAGRKTRYLVAKKTEILFLQQVSQPRYQQIKNNHKFLDNVIINNLKNKK